jgi:integrase
VVGSREKPSAPKRTSGLRKGNTAPEGDSPPGRLNLANERPSPPAGGSPVDRWVFDTTSLLVAERERHLRFAAGVPDGVAVNLLLVKLPADALMFPNPPAPGESFSFSALRNPRNTTKEFVRKATALGFPGLRLHDLRGTHETHLLDRGVSPAAVAKRCGHDPATMLRSYAKRTKKADAQAAEIIGMLSKDALR